jgi:hypothetical protein
MKHGNDPAYLAARIKRDRPDIAAAVERGEYKSIREAAIQAGIIKKPDPVQIALRAWASMTDEQRDEFRSQTQERTDNPLPAETDSTLSQLKRSMEIKRGLLDDAALREYDKVKKIDRTDYRALLVDRIVRTLSARLLESIPIMDDCLSIARDYEVYKHPDWLPGPDPVPFPDFRSYIEARVGKAFTQLAELEKTFRREG